MEVVGDIFRLSFLFGSLPYNINPLKKKLEAENNEIWKSIVRSGISNEFLQNFLLQGDLCKDLNSDNQNLFSLYFCNRQK
jgi:hypothetical protein